MEKKLLYEVKRLQKIAGLLKEDDFDLSDTPEFSNNLKSEMRSAFAKTGVDLNRPIFVLCWWGNTHVKKYDNPLDYGTDLEKEVGVYEDLFGESINVIFDTSVSPSDPALDRKSYGSDNLYGPVKGYENFPSTAKGKMQILFEYGDSEEEYSIIFQEPEESLQEDGNDFDLSDTPEFRVNYEDDYNFIEWLGQRELEDTVAGSAIEDYDLYDIGIRVLDSLRDPRLLKRVYSAYQAYKKKYGIK